MYLHKQISFIETIIYVTKVTYTTLMDFSGMTVKKLKEFALSEGITIPKSITRKSDIITFLENIQSYDEDDVSILNYKLADMVSQEESFCNWRSSLSELIGSGIEGQVFLFEKEDQMMAVKEQNYINEEQTFVSIRILRLINDIIASGQCINFPITFDVQVPPREEPENITSFIL